MLQGTVRCKVRCYSVTKRSETVYDSLAGKSVKRFVYDAKFGVVLGDSVENKKFFASTPSGSVEFTTLREDTFQPDQEYYVDLSLAPAVVPAVLPTKVPAIG